MRPRILFKSIDFGIKFELILKIFIVALFSSLLTGGLVYKFFESSLLHREKSQLEMIRSYVTRFNATHHIPIDFLSTYGLNSIWLMDKTHNFVFGFGEKPSKTELKGYGIRFEKHGKIFPRFIGVRALFRLKNGSTLYLKKRLNTFNEELFNIRKAILVIVLASTVLIILLLDLLLQATLTKPIRNIVNDIKQIENKKKELLEGNYLKELNYLVENFNRLLKLINIQRKELEKRLEEVEYLNQLLSRYHVEMSRFEKLVSLGELSAGIAHEIGNPLNNIIGYLNLSRDKIDELCHDPDLLDYFSRIEHETSRIDGIVRGMLEFSRKEGKLKLQRVDFIDVIEKTLDFSQLMFKKKDVTLKKTYPGHKVYVEVDPSRFKQVLLNIIGNAIDGIDNRGEIEIVVLESDRLNLIEERLLVEREAKISKGEKFVRLIIRDNGVGIDEKDLKHIFDPFFTTKEPGKGTGLGLSVSLQLIKEMKGILNIESEKGKGTTVTIVFRTCPKV